MSFDFMNDNKLDDFFPNGFESWCETFYEVIASIEFNYDDKNGYYRSMKVDGIESSEGRIGLLNLAKELTDKFEKLHEGKEWDGEYYDEMELFIEKELYGK